MRTVGRLEDANVRILEIPDDAPPSNGWRVKAQIMRQLAQHDVANLAMQSRWREATKGVSSRDYAGEIKAWREYMRRIRFTPSSLPYTQTFIRPEILFLRGYGDCVAQSTANATALGIAGYDVYFVFISTRPDKLPSHVYDLVFYPPRTHDQKVVLDTTVPMPAGWEVPLQYVTWSAIVPAFEDWTDAPNVDAFGGSPMIGDPEVRRNKYGMVEVVSSDQAPVSGRRAPHRYKATPFSGMTIHVPERRVRLTPENSFVYSRTREGLPHYDDRRPFVAPDRDIKTVSGIGAFDPSLSLKTNAHIESATEIHDAIARLYASVATNSNRPGDASVEGFWDDVKKKANEAASSAKHAVQQAASQVSHAISQGARSVQNEAHQLGHSLDSASKKAEDYAHKELQKAKKDLAKLVNKLKPTPIERVLLYLGAGPPGAIMAYHYVRHHQYEVVHSLPAGARKGMESMERGLRDLFEGKSTSISGYPIVTSRVILTGLGEKSSIGATGIFKTISDAWHRQSHKTQNEIIIALVVVAIITAVVLIVGTATVVGWLEAAWHFLVSAFSKFFSLIAKNGWQAIVSLIMGIFKHGGAPNIPDPSSLPDPGNTPGVDPSLADQFKNDTSDPAADLAGGSLAKAGGSFAATGLLGVLKMAIGPAR